MTVSELKRFLEKCDLNSLVYFFSENEQGYIQIVDAEVDSSDDVILS